MRYIAASLLTLLLLAPAVASAEPTQECRHLTQRIDFFSARLERARAVDDASWESRFSGHLEELIERRAAVCPGYSASDQAQAAMMELMKLGGEAALTFFTLGMM